MKHKTKACCQKQSVIGFCSNVNTICSNKQIIQHSVENLSRCFLFKILLHKQFFDLWIFCFYLTNLPYNNLFVFALCYKLLKTEMKKYLRFKVAVVALQYSFYGQPALKLSTSIESAKKILLSKLLKPLQSVCRASAAEYSNLSSKPRR